MQTTKPNLTPPMSQARIERDASADNAKDNRDLGFGSVVARESRLRFLNRDGSFNVRRVGLPRYSSVNAYHYLLTMPWWELIGIITTVFFLVNVVFAGLYLLCGFDALADSSAQPIANSFWRAFFFSVHTLATIGYGTLTPVGYLANFLVTIEALVGLIVQAFVLGILYARFARPTAMIVFSETAVVAPFNDKTAFMFRLVNGRSSQLTEVKIQLLLARFVEENGKQIRRFEFLKLEREQVSFLPLAWTIVHPIGEDSPMYNLTHEDLQQSDAEFLILLTANDETFAQTVHTRSSYKPDEILWNTKFADIYMRDNDDGLVTIDVRKLSAVRKIDDK